MVLLFGRIIPICLTPNKKATLLWNRKTMEEIKEVHILKDVYNIVNITKTPGFSTLGLPINPLLKAFIKHAAINHAYYIFKA